MSLPWHVGLRDDWNFSCRDVSCAGRFKLNMSNVMNALLVWPGKEDASGNNVREGLEAGDLRLTERFCRGPRWLRRPELGSGGGMRSQGQILRSVGWGSEVGGRWQWMDGWEKVRGHPQTS